MKNRLLYISILLATILGLSSCSSDYDEFSRVENMIIGEWEVEDIYMGQEYVEVFANFSPSKHFNVSIASPSGDYETQEFLEDALAGRWSFRGDRLMIHYDMGGYSTFLILEIDYNYMKLLHHESVDNPLSEIGHHIPPTLNLYRVLP